jgi:protein SCO1/2
MKRIGFLALLFAVCVPLGYYIMNQQPVAVLPVINPIDVQEEMVDPELLRVGHGHKVGKFSFQNQDNQMISEKDVKGKIYVAEYFFTTCKSICPIMNKQMQRVQTAFDGNAAFEILSFTVDPENDRPEQLLQYAKSHAYRAGQWHFITGKKEALYSLARTSFFVLKPAEAANLGDAGSDFIHTNNFVLVDQDRHIRGYYDGTNAAEVDQLILDIENLLESK